MPSQRLTAALTVLLAAVCTPFSMSVALPIKAESTESQRHSASMLLQKETASSLVRREQPPSAQGGQAHESVTHAAKDKDASSAHVVPSVSNFNNKVRKGFCSPWEL